MPASSHPLSSGLCPIDENHAGKVYSLRANSNTPLKITQTMEPIAKLGKLVTPALSRGPEVHENTGYRHPPA